MKASRIEDLIKGADVDLDEALVFLWDAGLGYVEDSSSLVRARDMKIAFRALGIEVPREQLAVEYWLTATGMSRQELTERLDVLGVTLPPRARKIPKNSLRRLRQLAGPSRTLPRQHVARTQEESVPLPAVRWHDVGSTPIRSYLELKDVCAIHSALEEDFAASSDPILPAGLRDAGLLDSAVARPLINLGGTLKYPTAEMVAAAVFHSIALNHAFFNGNKRTALVALLAFLDTHDLVLTCSENDLFRFTLKVAAHGLVPVHANAIADREVLQIAEWIRANSRRVERGERPMKWIRLKQRLRDFGCNCEPAGGVGNRLNISRKSERPRRFRPSRMETLHTQVAWAGDGTDADKNTVHKIRRDLRLDDDHDIDSATFYADATIDSFIVDYRRILRRLSKL